VIVSTLYSKVYTFFNAYLNVLNKFDCQHCVEFNDHLGIILDLLYKTDLVFSWYLVFVEYKRSGFPCFFCISTVNDCL